MGTWDREAWSQTTQGSPYSIPGLPARYAQPLSTLPETLQNTPHWQATADWLITAATKGTPTHGLTLAGNTGVGKTTILAALWYDLPAITGHTDHTWWPIYELLSYLKAPGYSPGERAHRMATVAKLDWFIIDDLGREQNGPNNWDISLITELIERRYDQAKPIFITTNLPQPVLSDRYGRRVVERILETSCYILAPGQSQRQRA